MVGTLSRMKLRSTSGAAACLAGCTPDGDKNSTARSISATFIQHDDYEEARRKYRRTQREAELSEAQETVRDEFLRTMARSLPAFCLVDV